MRGEFDYAAGYALRELALKRGLSRRGGRDGRVSHCGERWFSQLNEVSLCGKGID